LHDRKGDRARLSRLAFSSTVDATPLPGTPRGAPRRVRFHQRFQGADGPFYYGFDFRPQT